MKICVCADSHGNDQGLQQMADQERPDMILFLGDGERDWTQVTLKPQTTFAAVCGNCDLFSMEPPFRKFHLCERTIFMTHGHLYGAKQGIYGLMHQAIQNEVDLILYGHTHRQDLTEEGGRIYLCPGSMGYLQEKYAVIQLKEDGKMEITLQQLPQE